MDISSLIRENCECKMSHTCPIETVLIEDNATDKIYSLCENYKNILLIADKNTARVCADKVSKKLLEKLESYYIFDDELLVPDEYAVERAEKNLTEKTDLIIGVGSGVIQDLSKYVSFEHNLPYFVVATAPSMDGYASKGAAMIMGGMKVTYNAHVPRAILGDTEVLRNAPIDMLRSGYGDIVGKYSCLNDWKLGALVNGEYFCDYVYNLTMDTANRIKPLGKKIQERDPEAVKLLCEALIIVGIAMALVGNSRPASGSEHHLSHFFEITGILEDKPYFMHGIDVVFSSYYTAKIRQKLINFDINSAKSNFDRENWQKEIHRVYTSSAEGVIALQDKMGWYNEERLERYKEIWSDIVSLLGEAPSPEETEKMLEDIGLDIADFEKMYGKSKIEDAILYAKDLKDRYSVLWLNYDIAR